MGILHPSRILLPTQLAAQAHTAMGGGGGRGGGATNVDPRDGEESLIGRKDISNELILVELWTNKVDTNRTVCR